MQFGPTELIIILVIVVLLFGVGRISRLGGELGGAVKNFRRGMDDETKKNLEPGVPAEVPARDPVTNEPIVR